jgi:DNA-binding NtrC family response regulator
VEPYLPDGDGMDFVREVGLSRGPDSTVVLVTGRASFESAVEALRLGVDEYLTKPVEADRVRSLLRRVLHAEAAAPERLDDSITFRIGTSLDEVERRVTMATLDQCGGVKKHAAKTLGISLKTLYNRLEAYGLKEAPSSRSRPSG